jgi:hypothetical protein
VFGNCLSVGRLADSSQIRCSIGTIPKAMAQTRFTTTAFAALEAAIECFTYWVVFEPPTNAQVGGG